MQLDGGTYQGRRALLGGKARHVDETTDKRGGRDGIGQLGVLLIKRAAHGLDGDAAGLGIGALQADRGVPAALLTVCVGLVVLEDPGHNGIVGIAHASSGKGRPAVLVVVAAAIVLGHGVFPHHGEHAAVLNVVDHRAAVVHRLLGQHPLAHAGSSAGKRVAQGAFGTLELEGRAMTKTGVGIGGHENQLA